MGARKRRRGRKRNRASGSARSANGPLTVAGPSEGGERGDLSQRGTAVSRDLVWAALLLLLVLVAYGNALRAGYIWDDAQYLTQNPLMGSLAGLKRIWLTTQTPQYYPLVFTSFWVEHALWGLQPFGYHLVNVLLHGAIAVLVWRLLRRLGVPGAWLAAAIFALHPVQVESVAWVTERKNVLSGLFYLLALGRYLDFEERGRERDYGVALVLFVAALLSKSVAATMPAAALIVLWWREGRIRRSSVVRLLPFFALGALSGLATAWLEVHRVGAEGAAWDLGILQRVLLAGRIPWFYLSKLLWPAGLTFSYRRWVIDAANPGAWLGLLGLVVAGWLVWRERVRWGRGPAAAGAFFVVTLFPVLGFLNVYPMRYSYVADHFQYLASLGPITLGSALLVSGWKRVGWSRVTGRVAAGALLAVLGFLTLMQGRMYRDQETLWRATLARNPQSWMAHNNLGLVLAGRGQTDAAIGQFREALREHPDGADALSNLGGAFLKEGKLEEAEATLRKALALNPRLPGAQNSLAQVHLAEGRTDEAIRELKALVRQTPGYAAGEGALGSALLQAGRTDEAKAHLSHALALNPRLADVRFNLALLLGGESRHRETITLLRQGLRLQPSNPSFQQLLAWELATAPEADLRDGAEAVRLARSALARSPQDPVYEYTLAAALAETGDFKGALDAAEQAEREAERLGRAGQAATIRAAIARLQAGRPLHAGEP